MSLQRLASSATLLPLGACGGDASTDGAAASVERDSAGVELIEYSQDAWLDAPVWRLDSVPALSIGALDGPPEYEFALVTGALRLDDGTIVVADARASELRFFDSEGKYIRSVGRNGAGPGEYRYLTFFSHYGADSLLVWDFGLGGRGTILGRNGTYARTASLPDVGGQTSVLRVFGDGSLLGRVSHSPSPGDLGMVRFTENYIRFWLSGQVDTIARLFSSEGYNTGTGAYKVPFARRGVATAGRGFMHYTSSDSYEIRTYTADGQLVRVVRFARESPLTQDDIDRAIEKAGPSMRRTLSQVPYPETMPSYAAMKVDALGNLWVGDYLRPGEERQGWTILGRAGELLGKLTAPPHFTVYEIGRDYVLGSAPGELDVPRVLMYRLVKQSIRTR